VKNMRTLSLTDARRMAVSAQRLAEPLGPPTTDRMMDIARAIRCFQLDPISTVARSHRLVAWSRLGNFDADDFDRLIYAERMLFEYWAHAASIVLTEDFPLHQPMMRGYATGNDRFSQRVQEWVTVNEPLRQFILQELERNGPMLSREFEADGQHPAEWVSTGWTSGRNVSRMLDYLWITGRISVVGRVGMQKKWDLFERAFPQFTDFAPWDDEAVTNTAVQHAIRALGVARPADIRYHFIRNRYGDLGASLQRLMARGIVELIAIERNGRLLPGTWVAMTESLERLDELRNGAFTPRTTMLSPFDNLICDRKRTKALFDFDFTIEIYVPKEKRQFGYYVLPILMGERLVGRVDSQYDRRNRTYVVQRIYREPEIAVTQEDARSLQTALESLARFLGAESIVLSAEATSGAWPLSI